MKKSVIISSIVGVVVLAIVAGVWWLFSSNRLVYVADPEKGVAMPAAVCTDEDVDRYSLAATYTLREGFDEPGPDTTELNALRDEVVQKEGYQEDPTCQQLIFQVALFNDDYDAASAAYDAQLRFHEEGRFPNNNILGTGALYQQENYLQGLTGYDGPADTEGEFNE